MRVGIDYRILASGRSAATRGMPRFTQQQTREVVRRDPESEYVLFADHGADPALVLPEIRSAPNVVIRTVPEDVSESAARYEGWIGRQGVDVYHATTPFYLERLVLARFDVCPMVATLYDLIPLIFPAHYIVNADIQASYQRAAEFVSGAARVLAISEAARSDTHAHLGVPLDRIDVAAPFAEPCFRPLSADGTDAALSLLEARVDLPRSMILAVSHLHYTKNVEGLLRGWSLVPDRVRADAKLVVSCHLDPHGEVRIRDLARRLRISDDLVLTGLVTDAELAALYNRALFTVHPSRYEGFGLPVIEAMQCGTPVITSTASSLPEVAGGAAVLVHPEDAPGLAEAIVRLHGDHELRADLRERGLRRARHYTPSQLADDTVGTYRACIGQAVSPPSEGRATPGRVFVGGRVSGPGARGLAGPGVGREKEVDRLITDIMTWQAGIDEVAAELMVASDLVSGGLRRLGGVGAGPPTQPEDLIPDGDESGSSPVAAGGDAEPDLLARSPDPIIALLFALVPQGGLIVDVGARDGAFSLAAAAAGYSVVALDASSDNVSRLRNAVSRDGLHRLRVVHALVGDEPGSSPPSVAVGELVVELGVGPVSCLRIDLGENDVDIVDRLSGLLGLDQGPPVLFEAGPGSPEPDGALVAHILDGMEAMGYVHYVVEDDGPVPGMTMTDTVRAWLTLKAAPELPGWRVAPPRIGRDRTR